MRFEVIPSPRFPERFAVVRERDGGVAYHPSADALEKEEAEAVRDLLSKGVAWDPSWPIEKTLKEARKLTAWWHVMNVEEDAAVG